MTAPEVTREEVEHGAYNGWCRVEGIPLRALDCPLCRLVAALECIDRLRDGWSYGATEWRRRVNGVWVYEPMTPEQQAVMAR